MRTGSTNSTYARRELFERTIPPPISYEICNFVCFEPVSLCQGKPHPSIILILVHIQNTLNSIIKISNICEENRAHVHVFHWPLSRTSRAEGGDGGTVKRLHQETAERHVYEQRLSLKVLVKIVTYSQMSCLLQPISVAGSVVLSPYRQNDAD